MRRSALPCLDFAFRFVRAGVFALALALTLVLGASAPADAAQPQSAPFAPAAGAPRDAFDPDLRTGHAWAAVPVGRSSYTLLHFPARDDSAVNAVGRARRVADFKLRPEALGADQGTVWIVFPPSAATPAGGTSSADAQPEADADTPTTNLAASAPTRSPTRRVDTLEALRFEGLGWTYAPEEGTRSAPRLPGEGLLAGFLGDRAGPVALLQLAPPATTPTPPTTTPTAAATPTDAQSARWRLLRLDADRWVDLPLPAPLRAAHKAHAATLVRDPGTNAPALLVELAAASGQATLELWPLELTSPAASTSPVAPTRTFALPDGSILRRARVVNAESQLVALAAAPANPSTITIDALTPAGPRRIATTDLPSVGMLTAPPTAPPGAPGNAREPASSVAVLGLLGSPRVMLAWTRDPQPPSTPPIGQPSAPPAPPPAPIAATPPVPAAREAAANARVFELRELSTLSGRVVFDGPAKREGLISSRDFQILALLFGMLMAGLLFFVLRSDSTQLVNLPAHTSLPPVWKRAAAGAFDLLPGLLLSAVLFGRPASAVLMLSSPAGPVDALIALGLALAVAALICILFEWNVGRSPGKMLMALAIVALPAPTPPAAAPTRAEPPSPADDRAAPQTVDVSANAEPVGPSLAQAITRNLIRWIPPFALLMLLDSARRHPGDVLARTVVVQLDPDDEPAGANDEP